MNSYITKEAPFSVNLSDIMREETVNNINEEINETVFDDVVNQVYNLMVAGAYHKFLQSKYYKMYANHVDFTPREWQF